MKRFLSMLLVLVMVFSMIPQAAFADENVGEEIAPVAEKAEYVYNYEYIVAGDNAITLDPSAVTTIFCFEPTEADGEGTYSFTAEGAVVGNWGGSEWFLFNPGTTGNSVEWKCTGIGQSVYIGVSGVDSCTLTVSKVSEETGLIEWTVYQNTQNVNDYTYPCFRVEEGMTENEMIMVNFNHEKASITAMLGTSGVKYSDPQNGVYIDYTAALNEYATAAAANGGYFYLTPDLVEILPRINAEFFTFGGLTSWQDILVTAYEDHTGKDVRTETDEEGYTYEVCAACNALLNTDCPGYFEHTPIIIEFEMNEEWTAGTASVTVDPWYAWYYGVYTMGMNLTMNGEEVETSANPRVPTTFLLENYTNEPVTYEFALYTPPPAVGSFEKPADLVMGENVAEIEADSWGYYFNYTAEEDGTLTITLPEGDWTFFYVDTATGYQSDTQWSDSDPVVNPVTIEVVAGNTYQVVVNTYDPNVPWATPAGTITITAAFEGAKEEPAPGTEENPLWVVFDVFDEDWNFAYTAEVMPMVLPGTWHFKANFAALGQDLYVNGEKIEYTVVEGENGYTEEFFTLTNEGEEPIFPVAIVVKPNTTLTIPQATLLGASLKNYTEAKYYVTGEITEVYGTQYGNMYIKDAEGNTFTIYGLYSEDGATRYDAMSVKPVAGDVVTAYGVIGQYKGTAQMKNGWMTDFVDNTPEEEPEAPELTTPEEIVNAAYELEKGAALPGTYTLTGTVISVDEEYSTQYKNVTVTMVVGNMTDKPIKCYRLKGEGADALNVNDIITVTGTLKNYNDVIEFDQGCTLDALTNVEPPVEDEDNNASAIDFSSTAQRVTLNTNEQVWANDGITLTNTKGGSDIVDYSNPARFYKGSTVTIEYPGMTKIVFTSDATAKYVTALKDSLAGKGTITAEGSVITLELAEPADSITFSAAAQFRLKKLEVFAASSEGGEVEGCKHEIIHVPAVEPTCETEGNIEYWYCNGDCQLVWIDEELTLISNHLSVKLPIKHNVEHVAAVEPTCETEGNVEYWYCTECGMAWLQEDLHVTSLTNLKNVKLPIKHNVEHVAAVEPGCENEGNIEYWYCTECGMAWTDESLSVASLTNLKNVILGISHKVEHVAALAPTCDEFGNIEYWYCTECGMAWTDESLSVTSLTNLMSVKLAPAHAVEHVPAVKPTSTENGNIEYWYCTVCGAAWTDELLREVTNLKNVILPATGECEHAVVHVEAVEPGCHFIGNIEHWYCTKCDIVWADEAHTQLTNHKSVIVPALGGEVVHVEAVEPGCETEGNIEHWYCETCEQVWTDEALTKLSNHMSVKLGIAHKVAHVAAVEPTCETEGNVEYWYCTECGMAWLQEDLHVTSLTNLKNVKLPIKHKVAHVAAVEPTCETEGNVEYWYCTECGMAWLQEDLHVTSLTNLKNVKLPIKHNVEHVAAVEPGCENEGNIEYWYCTDCGMAWTDASLSVTSLTNLMAVKLGITHKVEHVAAVEPTCDAEGNIEYWFCTECGAAWTDELLRQVTNLKNVILPVKHNVEHVEAVEPGCENEGNIEYWYCVDCGAAWTDELLREVTNLKNVKLGIAHKVEHVEAKAATCFEEGNIEYWYCTECGAAWTDELQREVTNLKNVILPIVHNVEHVEAKAATCFEEGNVEYWYCVDCGAAWTDELLRQVTNLKSVVLPIVHNVEHVEAVAATCFEEGNVEYWYCVDCGAAWTDELLRQVTNLKNVIVPITHNLQHIEAVAPTCHDDGNVEYWYCQDCGYAWTDELLREVTNLKSVIVPATGEGNVVHMEAVAPGCHYVGHVEHWACYDCEKVWLDEALTQLTNRKNVIIPAVGGDVVHVKAVAATCQEEGNIEHWYCEECEQVWADEALTQLTNRLNVITPVDKDAHNWGEWKEISKKCQEKRTCQNGDCDKYEVRDIKHVDKDKDEECDVCGADLSNSKTGDMIMIAVVVMLLAGAAIVVLLTKKRREG